MRLPERARQILHALLPAALLAVATPGAPAPAAGQEAVTDLAARCAPDDPDLRSWCREVALGLRAAQGGVGLLTAGGGDLPGSASTVGWRLASVPRLTVAGRLQLARLRLPGVRERAALPAPGRSSTVTTARLDAAVGVFEGFSPAPTVGGILSVDLLGTGSVAFLPGDVGFNGDAAAYGAGARLGVLRESFTLPGVTVSAVQRWGGEVRLGSVSDGDAGQAAFDLSTTSLRATVGKDLLGVGLLAGVGWDRYAGDAEIAVRDERVVDAGARTGSASADGFKTNRVVYYGGASLSFLVVQLSAEGGWATGYDPIPDRAAGGFDPGDGTPFGSVAVRLIF